jgi:hypothetical protein
MDQDLIKLALELLAKEEELEGLTGPEADSLRAEVVRRQEELGKLRGITPPVQPPSKDVLESLPRSQENWPSYASPGRVLKARPQRKPKKKPSVLVMPFGKFQGQLITSLPKWYLKWAKKNLKQAKPSLKKAIKDALSGKRPVMVNSHGQRTSPPISGPLYVPYTGPATDIPWEE